MTNQPAEAQPDDGTPLPDPAQTGTEPTTAEPVDTAPAAAAPSTETDTAAAEPTPVDDNDRTDHPGVSGPGPTTPPLGYPGLSPQQQPPQYPPPGYAAPPPGYSTPPPGYPSGPGAGFPPPGGFPPPPPGTAGWAATRFGLVRPAQGRMLAGVCAAIARSTNTDPVLWRVLFAVLSLVGGFGVLAYVLGWLLIPAEGDTGSPAEALLGRGRSSTSPILVVVIGVLAVAALTGTLYTGVHTAAFLVILVLVAIILLNRSGRFGRSAPPNGSPTPGSGPPPGPMPPGFTAGGFMPGGSPPSGPPPTGFTPAGFTPTGPSTGTGGTPPDDSAPNDSAANDSASNDSAPNDSKPGAATLPIDSTAPGSRYGTAEATAAMPGLYPPAAPAMGMGMPDQTGTAPPPGGYRPAFAPHGPYASTTPYPYPGLIGSPPGPPPVPPPPRRPPSRLGRFIFSAVLFVLGVLAIIDVAGGSVPFAGYLAAALGVLGLGLVAGAFFGRARWMIPIGLLLVVVLAASTALQGAHLWPINKQGGDITWQPASVRDLNSNYDTSFGNATLDLSQLSFANTDTRTVQVRATAGNLTVLLPANVDTTVLGKVAVGNGEVFGEHWDGIGKSQHNVTDYGADGPGGGHLLLDLQLGAGNLEVHR